MSLEQFLDARRALAVTIYHCAECGVNLRKGRGFITCRKCGALNEVPER